MLRIPHCLGNWLTDGGKVVSITPAPLYSPEISYGACGIVVVKAICYKPEGRGFETR
jgi:hypothetical protein